MARGADVVRGTCTDATSHARPCGRAVRAHEAELREPTLRAGRAHVARTRGRVTRVHADARVVPSGERAGK